MVGKPMQVQVVQISKIVRMGIDLDGARNIQSFKPVPELISEINQQLQGWKNYFSIGHPQAAYWEIDWYVRGRLIQHLQRRSQRGFEFPKDRTIFQWFQDQGLIALGGCKAKQHPMNA
jgi:Group II intron, maturase-specific domain